MTISSARRARVGLLVSVLLSCAAPRTDARDELRVSQATQQTRTGGVAGRSTAQYTIVLMSGLPLADVRIDGIWMGDEYIAFTTPHDATPQRPATIVSAVDGAEVRYRISFGVDRGRRDDARDRAPTTAASPRPRPSVDARAVLDIVVRDARRYVPIPRFDALPSVHYP